MKKVILFSNTKKWWHECPDIDLMNTRERILIENGITKENYKNKRGKNGEISKIFCNTLVYVSELTAPPSFLKTTPASMVMLNESASSMKRL